MIQVLIPGSYIPFWGHFRGTLFSPIGLRRKISRNFWRPLAHNFVAHLSGCVRLKDGTMAWAFFAPELGKWVSSWDGWRMGGEVGNERSQNEVLYSGKRSHAMGEYF